MSISKVTLPASLIKGLGPLAKAQDKSVRSFVVAQLWNLVSNQYRVLILGNLSIDRLDRRVQVSGERVHLSPKLFELLVMLVLRVDNIVPYNDIAQAMWGQHHNDLIGRRMSILILKLRRKLGEPFSSMIVGVRFVGYKILSKRP